MIVIANGLVLSEIGTGPAGTPWIGWHNLVTPGTISADDATEEEANPVVNLANPATHLFWRGADTTEQFVNIDIPEVGPIDYLAVAGHNFGSAAIPVSVWGRSAVEDPWSPLVEERILANDSPVMFRFASQSLAQVSLGLQPGTAPPRAAVLYVGRLLVMERGVKIDTDHVPINLARKTAVVTGMSQSGNFLGQTVSRRWNETKAAFSNIQSEFYRSEVDPFVLAAIGGVPGASGLLQRRPFFFAWSPIVYPADVGYVWLTADPEPPVTPATGRMSIELSIQGIA